MINNKFLIFIPLFFENIEFKVDCLLSLLGVLQQLVKSTDRLRHRRPSHLRFLKISCFRDSYRRRLLNWFSKLRLTGQRFLLSFRLNFYWYCRVRLNNRSIRLLIETWFRQFGHTFIEEVELEHLEHVVNSVASLLFRELKELEQGVNRVLNSIIIC